MRNDTWLRALSIVLVMGTSSLAHAVCDWSTPGHDKYTGNYEQAMAHYRDIDPERRARLLDRMNHHYYDRMVSITSNDITAADGTRYSPDLWGMHFGADKVCMQVVRPNLVGVHTALAYTDGPDTVYVMSDCNNVTRGTQLGGPPAAVGAAPSDGGGYGYYLPPVFETPAPPALPGLIAYHEAAGAPVIDHAVYYPETPYYLPGSPILVGGPGYIHSAPYCPPIGHVAAVPEVATWLLMFAGVVTVMWPADRRKRTTERRMRLLQALNNVSPAGLYAGGLRSAVEGTNLLTIYEDLEWLFEACWIGQLVDEGTDAALLPRTRHFITERGMRQLAEFNSGGAERADSA